MEPIPNPYLCTCGLRLEVAVTAWTVMCSQFSLVCSLYRLSKLVEKPRPILVLACVHFSCCVFNLKIAVSGGSDPGRTISQSVLYRGNQSSSHSGSWQQ